MDTVTKNKYIFLLKVYAFIWIKHFSLCVLDDYLCLFYRSFKSKQKTNRML